MNQTPVSLIGTLRVSFSFHPSLYTSRTKSGIARIIRATISSQKLSAKQIAGLGPYRFLKNKLYDGSLAFPTGLSHGFSLSIGLAGSHYIFGIRKAIYCTEIVSEITLPSSPQTSPTIPQSTTTKETKENFSSPSSTTDKPDKSTFSPFDSFNAQQITFGASMGFASGYFVKEVSKTAAVLVGATFVFLQILEQQGYIKIDWSKFEENYNKVLDLDEDGKVTTNDLKLIFFKVVEFFGRNFQTDASFMIGFGVGFRYG
ncbi:10667_t:CDS:2 [Funneliformis geosporum]|uniref:9925_t:CDS:1 n=1 Tax=Funneliformis geosporum TaxID=1117311 RepID=A0A9W4WR50_9GLOM|nr:10667_t:CDS:2 [Funneliformis geosporum]CAI2180143.1 9925_t:CDS:2 [Funneliformis geosporum]